MTPLAHFFAKELVSLRRNRRIDWLSDEGWANLRKAMEDIHCFELSAAKEIVVELTDLMVGNEDKTETLISTLGFLPAPKTWLEMRHSTGNRFSILLEETNKGKAAAATFFCDQVITHLGYVSLVSGDFYDGHPGGMTPRYLPTWATDWAKRIGHAPAEIAPGFLSWAQVALIAINSPHIIGRKQHMPHRGIERQIVKQFGVGKFPLHAWTEIKLEVSKPIEIDDGEPHQAHLTGRRALHFCRKHIRIRNGRLEYVRAHWRGDAAIGIKRSRYKVVA